MQYSNHEDGTVDEEKLPYSLDRIGDHAKNILNNAQDINMALHAILSSLRGEQLCGGEVGKRVEPQGKLAETSVVLQDVREAQGGTYRLIIELKSLLSVK